MGMIAYFAALAPSTLQQLQDHPDEIEAYLYPDGGASEPPHSMDLDKSWHGLHYLLTGTAFEGTPPLALAILGGAGIGDEADYGPVRFLTPGEVASVAAALSGITAEELTRRYDPEAMEEQAIYPQIWASEGAEALDYLLDYFGSLQAAYAEAAARGDAVLLWIA